MGHSGFEQDLQIYLSTRIINLKFHWNYYIASYLLVGLVCLNGSTYFQWYVCVKKFGRLLLLYGQQSPRCTQTVPYPRIERLLDLVVPEL